MKETKHRILIVDDERSIRMTLAKFLNDAHYEAVAAEDAIAAEKLFKEQPFDLVVTDIILPKITGVELMRIIHTIDPDALIIVMTGEPTVETAVEAVRTGAYDYLAKPVAKETILNVVAKAVRVRDLQKDKKKLEEANYEYQLKLQQMVEERTSSLRESEALYQSLVENIPLTILRKDLQGRYVFANQRFCKSVGKSLAEVLGKTDPNIFPAALAFKYQHEDRLCIESKKILDIEEEYQGVTGGVRFVRSIRTPVYDLDGRVSGLQCIFWDITDRKRIEDQLRQLARAVEQSPISIMITDPSGCIEFVNPKFTQVTGYSAEEVIGKNPRILKSGETTQEEYRQLWETIAAGNPWRGEFRNKRKDGTAYFENVSISAIRDESQKITHYVAVREDVSERKQLESKFLRAQRLEAIGSLASGIAHDLNNILAPIMMCAPMLRTDLSPKERADLTANIEICAQRAVDIVKQLLSFGRGDEGRRAPFQIKHLLKEMGKIMTETFPRSIQLTQDYPDNVWTLVADSTQIRQVLLNLCVNARDAMPKGGHLMLQAQNVVVDESYASMHPEAKVGPYVLIKVRDTGIGISEENRKHIFDPFFSTKGPESGTGLGLTTVLGIVKDHKGFITLDSTPGKGTTFEVYLPASPDARYVNENQIVSSSIPKGSGQCILIVDDEQSIRNALKRTLEEFGYKTMMACDGVDGLDQFTKAQNTIALIVTDLGMPLMDGLTFCRTVRRLSPQMPIIISTGTAWGEARAEAQHTIDELKIERVLLKPYTANALLLAVNEILSRESQSTIDSTHQQVSHE